MSGERMTKSTTPQTPAAPKQPAPKAASGRSWAFLVFIFRLLLLGVGGGLAALIGVAIAQFFPAPPTQEPPFAEKVVQGSQSLLTQLKQLPQTWSHPQSPASPSPASSPNTPAASSPQAASPAPQSSPLSDAERQQLQNELTQLQTQLQTLTENSTEPLKDRVAAIQSRIQAIQQRLSSFTAAPGAATQNGAPLVAPAAASLLSGDNQLMVTLPSDALFGDDQRTLRPGTEPILDTITADLQRYPGATIQVGAHSDNQGSADSDRTRTFEQAKAIEQYLAGKLGNKYHWITVGYGHSRPVADSSSPINRQRNRRIEIAISPK
jgi:OmpA-OmpF porin, OOP family